MSVQQGIVSEPSGMQYSSASAVEQPPSDWTDSKKKQY